MAQIYIAVNIDQEEYIHPFNINVSAKMKPIFDSDFSKVISYLQFQRESTEGFEYESTDSEGRWAGDRVVLIGEYSDEFTGVLKLFGEISEEVIPDLNSIESNTEYELRKEKFEHEEYKESMSGEEAQTVIRNLQNSSGEELRAKQLH